MCRHYPVRGGDGRQRRGRETKVWRHWPGRRGGVRQKTDSTTVWDVSIGAVWMGKERISVVLTTTLVFFAGRLEIGSKDRRCTGNKEGKTRWRDGETRVCGHTPGRRGGGEAEGGG